ncbi:MAG: hypothetical protein H7144_09585 [Burkholderiales bacterium]|nr:hypothetical protein [Phycisphaerae bacterium]
MQPNSYARYSPQELELEPEDFDDPDDKLDKLELDELELALDSDVVLGCVDEPLSISQRTYRIEFGPLDEEYEMELDDKLPEDELGDDELPEDELFEEAELLESR